MVICRFNFFAKSLFYIESSVVFDDEKHSKEENRFMIVGFSDKARLLLACFCERLKGNVIRIISARKLTKKERNDFTSRWFK